VVHEAPGGQAASRLKRRAVAFVLRTHGWLLRFATRPLAGRGLLDLPKIERSRPLRFLVIRLDELGDLLLTTQLLLGIADRYPGCSIEIVVHCGLESVFRDSPVVTSVSTLAVSASKLLKPVLLPLRILAWRWRRRGMPCPDVAMNARGGPDSAYAGFLAFVSGAQTRLAITEHATPRKSVLNAGFDRFYTATVGSRRLVHEADASASLLGLLPESRRRLDRAPADLSAASGAAVALSSSAPRIALCVSGGHSRLKRWPVERFAQLAARLSEQLSATIVVVGNRDDAALAAQLQWPAGTADLAGKTSLDELKAILKSVDAYVGADVGPTHLAATVGVPTVALFGSSVPALFAPRGSNVTVLWRALECNPMSVGTTHDATEWSPDYFGPERCIECIYGTPRCMEELSVEQVFDALARALLRAPDV